MKDKAFSAQKSEEEWEATLSSEQYHVLRQHGTERPGSSPLNAEKRDGVVSCRLRPAPLQLRDQVRERNGLAQFLGSRLDEAVDTTVNRQPVHDTHGGPLRRTAGDISVMSFPMGPHRPDFGYCMNGVSLKFRPDDGQPEEA